MSLIIMSVVARHHPSLFLLSMEPYSLVLEYILQSPYTVVRLFLLSVSIEPCFPVESYGINFYSSSYMLPLFYFLNLISFW